MNTQNKKSKKYKEKYNHKYMYSLIQTKIMYSGPVETILKVEEMMRWADKDGDGRVRVFLIWENISDMSICLKFVFFVFNFNVYRLALRNSRQ